MQTTSTDVILIDDQAEVTIIDDDQSLFSINDLEMPPKVGPGL